MMQLSLGSPPLAAMPAFERRDVLAFGVAPADPLRLGLVERAAPARLLRRQHALARVDRLQRGSNAAVSALSVLSAAARRHCGEIAAAELRRVAGGLRRTRRLGGGRRRCGGGHEDRAGDQTNKTHAQTIPPKNVSPSTRAHWRRRGGRETPPSAPARARCSPANWRRRGADSLRHGRRNRGRRSSRRPLLRGARRPEASPSSRCFAILGKA